MVECIEDIALESKVLGFAEPESLANREVRCRKHRSGDRIDRGSPKSRRGRCGICRRVEYDPRHGLACLVNPVDQLALMIGLPEDHLEPQPVADDLAPFLDLRERRVTVDVRLAFAQQVQVGAVQKSESST